MADRITEEERDRIIAYLKSGKSQGWIAGKVGRNKSTVSRIAKVQGIDSNVAATKKATDAKRDYSRVERLKLLNEGFDKARELLGHISEVKDLQAWTVATGTLVDKRRLEDGEATSREEKVDPERRKKIKDSLDELAVLRRQRMG